MAQRGTHDISDYVNDYERTMQDYAEMGPLWAEMVFGDDFEAMKAIYGGRGGNSDYARQQYQNDQDTHSSKRR
jgi:hypothetical protein